MRFTAKPQLCAMSLALDAQGDTVPKRGATMILSVLAFVLLIAQVLHKSTAIAIWLARPHRVRHL
jgi:hypothetical protein